MDGKMNPSTYQQVRENMKLLNDFFGDGTGGSGSGTSYKELIERIEKMEDTITKIVENPTGGGDTIVKPDGTIKVYGLSVDVQHADADITPGAYTRDITYELKKPAVVKLDKIGGFEGKYVLICTYKRNLETGESVDLYEYKPQQVAYSSTMTAYTRTASDATSSAVWGEWVPVIAEAEKAAKQIIQSETEPLTQTEGDYWCEPIEVS